MLSTPSNRLRAPPTYSIQPVQSVAPLSNFSATSSDTRAFTASQAHRTPPSRSKPPTIQPYGRHTVLARAASTPLLNAYQTPNSIYALHRRSQLADPIPADSPPVIPALYGRERTLYGTTSAPRPKSSRPRPKHERNAIVTPRDIHLDMEGVWDRFVQASLHPERQVDTLIEEKQEHPLGRASAELSPFHAMSILEKSSLHALDVVFNSDEAHLNKWKKRTDLLRVEPKAEYMEELFLRVACALEYNYGWHRQRPTPGSSAQHYIIRPGIPSPNLPVVRNPHRTRVDMLFLPSSPQKFITREGEFWRNSIAQQFGSIRGHRHTIIGLAFHSWMNNADDVAANADAIPPPIWFLLYAMQAAYPGIFVIREETENEQLHQTIERGLPPYDVLTDPGCGAFFYNLLGEEGYTATCEAALDARTSTSVDLIIKGSVRPRARQRANSSSTTSGLPPLPPVQNSRIGRLFKRPSWLGLRRQNSRS